MASKKTAKKKATKPPTRKARAPDGEPAPSTPPTFSTPPVFFRTQQPIVQPKRKPPARFGLRELVPSAVRPEGETNAFLRDYKAKWLSRLDFQSDSHVESILLLCFMCLALDRPDEAERFADHLIRYVNLKTVKREARLCVVTAMFLSSWLKARRKAPEPALLARARAWNRTLVHRDLAWLTEEASAEIDDAQARKRMSGLVEPLHGIVVWLHEGAGATTAQTLLRRALEVLRGLMV